MTTCKVEEIKGANTMTNNDSYVFDLHKAVPMYTMPEDERKEIWSDIVHFTAKGYGT